MEQWKIIKGLEKYSISSKGRVKNNKFKMILIPQNNGRNYLQVRLSDKDKKIKALYIHRLVAINFIENNDINKKQINHINGIKSDNTIENLEWCTAKENIIHSYEKKLVPLTTNGRKVINIETNEIHKSVVNASKELGITSSYLSSMLSGRQKNNTNFKYYTNE